MSRSLAVLWLCLVAAGCLRAKSPTCTDGRVCADDQVCAPFGGCAAPEQVAACGELAESVPCRFSAGPGICRAGVCELVGCGNGMPDPGELCDDGNTTSGDGCRADCMKVEVCGDGLEDAGEKCDDANDNPSDGCDHCQRTTWSITASVGTACALGDIGCPIAIAIDASGSRYVADREYHRVFRVTAGVITRIAGDAGGAPGSTGDNGDATSALLDNPAGLALDMNGDLYIADQGNNRIRMVAAADGKIRNVAGTGTYGFGGANGQPAASAQFRGPRGLFFDSSAHVLYVADTGNHVIRAIDLSPGAASATISTVAGTPANFGDTGDGSLATAAFLYQPAAVTRCANGDLLIADTGNNRVRRIAAGVITTVVGDGIAASAGEGSPARDFSVDTPLGVACDARGNVFVSSSTTVRVLGANSASVVDGSGPVLSFGAFSCTSAAAGPLGGLVVVDDKTVAVVHACGGALVELTRAVAP